MYVRKPLAGFGAWYETLLDVAAETGAAFVESQTGSKAGADAIRAVHKGWTSAAFGPKQPATPAKPNPQQSQQQPMAPQYPVPMPPAPPVYSQPVPQWTPQGSGGGAAGGGKKAQKGGMSTTTMFLIGGGIGLGALVLLLARRGGGDHRGR